MHLVLDQMWVTPETLFWPFLGTAFPREELADWTSHLLSNLMNNPTVYVPELLGVAILIWFALLLLTRKKVTTFIKQRIYLIFHRGFYSNGTKAN